MEELLPPLLNLRYLQALDLICKVWCALYASRVYPSLVLFTF